MILTTLNGSIVMTTMMDEALIRWVTLQARIRALISCMSGVVIHTHPKVGVRARGKQ